MAQTVTRAELDRVVEAITFKSPIYAGLSVQKRPGGWCVMLATRNGGRTDLTRTASARETLAYLTGTLDALDMVRKVAR